MFRLAGQKPSLLSLPSLSSLARSAYLSSSSLLLDGKFTAAAAVCTTSTTTKTKTTRIVMGRSFHVSTPVIAPRKSEKSDKIVTSDKTDETDKMADKNEDEHVDLDDYDGDDSTASPDGDDVHMSEFCKLIAEKVNSSGKESTKVTLKLVKGVMDAYVSSIKDLLKQKKKVKWQGLGTFSMKEVKARTYNNPQDPKGEKYEKPARFRPHFKISQLFAKELTN